MGKLSTWLVVALTATAFVVGLTGRAIVGGGGGEHSTPTSSTPSTTSPGAVPTISTAGKNPAATPKAAPARRHTASVPSTSTATTGPTAAGKPRSVIRAVLLPETNPVAVGAPTTTGPEPVAAPATPISAAVGTPAPPTGTSSTPGEPGEVEPSARRASIGAAVGQLQAAAADTSEVVQGVVQELCLELLHASLPSGAGAGEGLPFTCDSN
jgi:hypothetical protein